MIYAIQHFAICHKRTVHTGRGITSTLDDTDLDQPVCPRTGYEDTEEYREEMDKHWDKIRDNRSESDVYTFLNKQ